MKFILLSILFFCGLDSFSQDSTNQKASKYFLDDITSLKFEGSIYISESLPSNNSFVKESAFIYNLSLKISNKILIGLSTQDTKIDNEPKHINHFLMKYNFNETDKQNFYLSLKVPSSKFTNIENDQLKFLRAGFGYKFKVLEIEKSTISVDLNHDYMLNWDNKTIFNHILLIGLSISNNN
tara:strand:+ start:4002 stop:4544 length:543 start_codon:yes stop_codon:yes gene_type:complete